MSPTQPSTASPVETSPDLAHRLQDALAELAAVRAELSARTEALERATHAAEAANEARDRFIAAISHELRTPLSAILLWVSLIEDRDDLPPGQLREAVEAIKDSAEEQRVLVEDIVETSRLLSGRLRLDFQDVDLAAVIRAALDPLLATAREQQVEIREALDPAVVNVRADPRRLQQFLTHLLRNALHATPPGGRVDVTLGRSGNDVLLAVTDTGRGLAPEALTNLFDRVPPAGKCPRSECGLGLGLLLARRIVELHQGRLVAHSAGPGRGARFTAHFPMPALATANAAALQLGGRLHHRRLLLVDDQPVSRQALAAILREAGATVEVAASADATPTSLAFAPDVIVVSLPPDLTVDHAFFPPLLPASPGSSSRVIPAVALTASSDPAVVDLALSSGFQTCLLQPIDPLHLVATLATVIDG